MAHLPVTVGFDIGSVSINTVVCSPSGDLIEELPYRRHFGRTVELCAELLKGIEDRYGQDAIERVVFTGTHGKAIAEATNTFFEIETTAQTRGLHRVMPDARTIISIGGHDSTLLVVDPGSDSFLLEDFKLNDACAAGTGSFIDQQAERIYADLPQFAGMTDPQARIEAILTRFIEEGLKSDQPANVACRCTVFTKSDMIHLQNKGIAIRHIIAGLHEGVAKNFKSTLITNRHLKQPIAFIGGYASNILARRSFEKILEMPITVPPHHTSIGAYGACLAAQTAAKAAARNTISKTAVLPETIGKNKVVNQPSAGGRAVRASEIAKLRSSAAFSAPTTPPLCLSKTKFTPCGEPIGLPAGQDLVDVYMGFDIGSTTTKLVIIDPSGNVLYKRYIPTEGQPVVAIKKALRHAINNIDTKRLRILAIGTTGSGREVANLFVGADDVVNEVTAHARGTTFFRPDVDTIFELGGQDAKYTALSNGYVVDFRMNKVCAAGTGSFLEETAHKLGINIAKEYESLAMASKAPYKLTERCTVYMESDLMSYLQMGGAREDLLAGLAQAVVHNYLNRVVQDGRIGEVISFQGGPSLNEAVVAAFEMITGRPIITLPHREVMGAIGAALHARDEREARLKEGKNVTTRFRGWDIVDASFSHVEEICHRNPNCHNQCKLQVYRVGKEEAVYGGECGMYESRAQAEVRAPDFNKIRQNLFFKYMEGKYRVLGDSQQNSIQNGSTSSYASGIARNDSLNRKPVVGIPRCLSFFQLGLAWVHLFDELGFDVLITPETDNKIVDDGIEAMTCEACFPVKISHGHTRQLIGHCDYLFLPMMIEMHAPKNKKGYYCPYLEANPYMLKAALKLDDRKIIMPAIYLKEGPERLRESFQTEFERLKLPFDAKMFDAAWQKAETALAAFDRELKRIGSAFLEKLGNQRAIVVVGRPYSAYDSRTNLNLFATFSRLGIMAIPQEFFDLEGYPIEDDYPNMYWGFGDKILRAARMINHDPRLFGLYLTSFSCGPDSFILHFFNHEMARTGRPYLELELDEHSAGAGVETRLLAFLDVIKNQRQVKTLGKNVYIQPRKAVAPLRNRTIYIPKMSEGSEVLAAAFEGVGCKARVMETYTKSGIEFGKRNTSGKECYPCTVTTGDMFNLISNLHSQGVDVENEIAFFMPETEGPCRFGQYNRLHRILLERYGLGAVPILSPSSEDAYKCNGFFTDEQAAAFRKLGFEAIVYADLLEKALWRVRPYEVVPGTADRVFAQTMREGIEAIRRGGGLRLLKAARRAAAAFAAIEVKPERRPLIGIVGEIYVRTHKESNQNLVRTLEQMGCETYTSSVSEWIDYTTHTSISEAYAEAHRKPSLSSYGKFVSEWLTGRYQRMVEKILGFSFRNLLQNRFDHETSQILHEVEGLFSNHINGEAILSIGGALTFARDGFNGVVNVMPFTCMPSTIASSILKVALRQKIPYVDMIYDGTILPNRETNLATFVYQARQNLENRM